MFRQPQHPSRWSARTLRVGVALSTVILIGVGVAVGRLIPNSTQGQSAGVDAAGASSPGGATGPATGTSPAPTEQCANPQFETSDPTGGWSDGGFAETSPDVGIYNDAYDIWLNGVDTVGSDEVMIWNQNHGQTPAGSVVAVTSLGGRTYQVWKYGGYIAFVAEPAFTSGTVNLLAFFNYVVSQEYIAPNPTLGQIDYGVELVSTNGAPATFTFTNFSVTTG